MNYNKWFIKNTNSLNGKRIAVSGSTGGLGKQICRHLCKLGADLILLDRNKQKSEENKELLNNNYPNSKIDMITVDFENIVSVHNATEKLKDMKPDALIINAGAYSIPRHKCTTGYDNVYQINFASPYYMVRELLPTLRAVYGGVVAVGSIAHNYSHIDSGDIDFSSRDKASKVYGNAKRYLMFSLYELFKDERDAFLSVVHPGITFTNITAHYPKLIFAVIKHPMKVIFMTPRKASLSVVKGIFIPTEYHTWIGPRVFNVWGLPEKKRLTTADVSESGEIFSIAESVYDEESRILADLIKKYPRHDR